MRIVKEFNHGPFRCTLLHYNDKFTLKIEDEYGEVNYKLGNVEEMDPEILPDVLEIPDITKTLLSAFQSMKTGRNLVLQILSKDEDHEGFEEII